MDSLIASKGCGNKHNCFSCSRICQIRQENRYCVDAPMGKPFSCTTMNVLDSIENDIGSECMFLNLELAYHRAGDHEPAPCCKECKNKCGYACNKAAHQKQEPVVESKTFIDKSSECPPDIHQCIREEWGTEPDEQKKGKEECKKCWRDWEKLHPVMENDIPDTVNDKPEIVDNDKEIENDVDESVIETSENVIEESESVIEEVETFEADIIQTVPEELPKPIWSAKHHLKEAIKREEEQISQLKDSWIKSNPDALLKHETILLALKLHLTDMEYPDPVPTKHEQPELPILKNNDQRAAFVDAYVTWPIWINQEKTGERYYRYDFENGVIFVIRVNQVHKFLGWNDGGYSKTETEYGKEEYFLLGDTSSNWGPKVKTFHESSTNKSALIEYLKDLQKK